jgi:MtN3 and saliva related transmembrane protein
MQLIFWIGASAAALTSLSYLPQVKKAWPPGSTADLSLKMLIILTSGLWLWVIYGLMRSDWMIIAANVIGGSLSFTVLLCKLRDRRAAGVSRAAGSSARQAPKAKMSARS